MSLMIFGWHPVSNSTRPLSCSIRIGGQTKVNGSGRSWPIGGIVNVAPARPHIRRHFALLMVVSSDYPSTIFAHRPSSGAGNGGDARRVPGIAAASLALALRELGLGL